MQDFSNVRGGAVCLLITRRYMVQTKTVKGDKVDVIKTEAEVEAKADTDRKWMNISKLLLNSKPMNAIWNADMNLDYALAYYTLPAPMKSRTHMVSLGMLDTVEGLLVEHETVKRPGLVDTFITSDYDRSIEEAKTRLGPLFNQEEYPSAEEARKAFVHTHVYMELDNVIKSLLRSNLATLVGGISERLQLDEKGKRKIFRPEALRDIQSFVKTFPARNVNNDEELKGVVERVGSLLDRMDLDVLKISDALRTESLAGFDEVKAQLEILAPGRLIELE